MQAAILWPRDALSIFEVLYIYPLTSLRITIPLNSTQTCYRALIRAGEGRGVCKAVFLLGLV